MPFSSRVALGYLIATAVYLTVSDKMLAGMFPASYPEISLYKGYVFTLLTAFLLFLVLRREERNAQRLHQKLEEAAIYDSLTGLLNRGAFASHLEAALQRARRTGHRLGLAFIDLDGFKTINDRYGHEGGDQLLVQVAERLRATLRSADLAARLGGDEFVVVIEPDPLESAETLARRLLDSFRESFLVEGEMVSVTLSIGIAHFPDDASEAGHLLRAADMAMYKVKGSGRNGFSLAEKPVPPPPL